MDGFAKNQSRILGGRPTLTETVKTGSNTIERSLGLQRSTLFAEK